MRWHSKGQATRQPHRDLPAVAGGRVLRRRRAGADRAHLAAATGRSGARSSRSTSASTATRTAPSRSCAGEIGVSITPGGVFRFDRMVEGLRNSALGGMWDPAYFNYGIAMHGAINVPLHPASHGCIRMSQTAGRTFHEYIDVGDQVFVWDGVKEPEYYAQNPNAAYPRGQLPIFNRIDPTYTTTTTSTTAPPTSAAPTVAQTQARTPGGDAPPAPRPTPPPTRRRRRPRRPPRRPRRRPPPRRSRPPRAADRGVSRRRPRPGARGPVRAAPSARWRRTARGRCRASAASARDRQRAARRSSLTRTPATRPSWRRSRPIATRSTPASERTRR